MDILKKCLEAFDEAVADTPAPKDGATSEEAQELYRAGFMLGLKMALKFSEEVPFVSFSNTEIKEAEPLGEAINCERCGEVHQIEYGVEKRDDGSWYESRTLAFVVCGDKQYIVGIKGKKVFPKK